VKEDRTPPTRGGARSASPEPATAGEALPTVEPGAGGLLEHIVSAGLGTQQAGAAPGPRSDDPGQVLTGRLEGVDDEGRVFFRAEGAAEPVAVEIGLLLPDRALVHAARGRERALVVRTADPQPRWVLVGLVRERVSETAAGGPGELQVVLDGETVRLTAERQIELKCGDASLLLRKDGRVVLSGNYLLSNSRGPIKIKGATIALN
jgi:hypothetical protein